MRALRLALTAGESLDTVSAQLVAPGKQAGRPESECASTVAGAREFAEKEGPAELPNRPAPSRALPRSKPSNPAGQGEEGRAVGPTPARPTDAGDGADDLATFTDVGNAKRFVTDHKSELRYCHERGWLRWDGGRWTGDDLHPMQRAQQTARTLASEGAATASQRDAPRLVASLLASRTVAAMVSLARPFLAVHAADLDLPSELFNCANGTLDLTTGDLRPHRAADLLTKRSPVSYVATAVCPTWDRFLARVLPDEAVRAYVQRLAGYALLGDVRDHVLPVFWGSGANGKSTYLEAVQFVMGDYARTIPSSVLLTSRDDKHPTERAQLAGLRFAVANETNAGLVAGQRLVDEDAAAALALDVVAEELSAEVQRARVEGDRLARVGKACGAVKSPPPDLSVTSENGWHLGGIAVHVAHERARHGYDPAMPSWLISCGNTSCGKVDQLAIDAALAMLSAEGG